LFECSPPQFDQSTVPEMNEISQPFPGILLCFRLAGRLAVGRHIAEIVLHNEHLDFGAQGLE